MKTQGYRNFKILLLLLSDVCGFGLGAYAFLQLHGHLMTWAVWLVLLVTLAISLLSNWLLRLYHSLWRFISLVELVNAVLSISISCVSLSVGMFFTDNALQLIELFTFAMVYALVVMGVRTSYRVFRMYQQRKTLLMNSDATKRVLIVGAGEAGNMLLAEALKNPRFGYVVGFLDDDPAKRSMYAQGKRVLGCCADMVQICEKHRVDRIIIAIPSASEEVISNIVEIASHTSCKVRIMPRLAAMIERPIDALRDVELEDLLGRQPVKLDTHLIRQVICGETVLVTGGGGSIGSELCRQIAAYKPHNLVILDIYENSVYDLQQELNRTMPDLKKSVVIASVRDPDRLNDVFRIFRPTIVFHAAAHKHVPLMEDSPEEAIKNNVFGTFNVCEASIKYGVRKFILISTDKAVNPTNVMGCSKRIAEMVIQSMNGRGGTEFSAVRFGNVLGSNGSVIPLFRKQIQAGGPVTVTDANIVRYFMTIAEAVQLVLQAGALSCGGEIFVLDMGKPVKIIDLARKIIRLSGYTPDVTMPIVISGLRPGEKMYEELLADTEKCDATLHEKIFTGHVENVDYAFMMERLAWLGRVIAHEPERLREALAELVPTYHTEEQTPERRKASGE